MVNSVAVKAMKKIKRLFFPLTVHIELNTITRTVQQYGDWYTDR